MFVTLSMFLLWNILFVAMAFTRRNKYHLRRWVAKGIFCDGSGYDAVRQLNDVANDLLRRELIFCDGNGSLQKVNFLVVNWYLHEFDVNNAFLHGDLNGEVYIQLPLPPGYSAKNNSKLCKFLKSLYGLKQASRQWNAKLLDFVIKLNFIPSKVDYSLFIKTKDGYFTAVLIYVDDIIVTSSSLDYVKQLKSLLNEKFKIKDLGVLKFFIGIEVARSEKGIYICQWKMLCTCFVDSETSGATHVKLPLD